MTPPLDRLPSLNALRAFEVASRHLNFRLAGQELGVTQGAVAQQIRALEAELGMKLFERHPRTLVLTANGQRYVVGVRRAFDLLAEATRGLRPEPGHLTVSVTPTFATKWLMPRLGAYTHAHPTTELRVLATERISHFQTEAIDLAVRYGRPPFGPGLQADLLFEECLVAVGSPQAQAQWAGAGRTTLLHDGQSSWEEYFERCAHGRLLPANPAQAIRFNQTTLAIDAALMGQGLALVQEQFVAQDLAAGRLVRPFPDTLRTDAGYYLVCPRKQRHPEAVAQARRWFLQQAAQSQ
ncbi:transcriptional regulator, LysR family [Paracidovorax avenae ATCC 19860]|uniref:Transcriptional regulator, LysR family n=1 Tax=Paracidovorax avenae (strain ATCC 19860 / DSM 7227 / CCUG 15838 / JCM 20985 / LMG 2117 / NCPPB 1011) TaxID=643561 RepID=F0Q442_PARA1|nr:LysR substrate-binding domain-containing protein [Paracidovorax avenae]ADX46751.1 transcriptional regulator, LysR family [Paracidovorax avenae ATCC 19860]